MTDSAGSSPSSPSATSSSETAPSEHVVVTMNHVGQLGDLVAQMANAGFEIKTRKEPKERDDKSPAEVAEDHIRWLTSALASFGAVYHPATGIFRQDKDEYTPQSMTQRVFASMPGKAGWSMRAAEAAMETFINRQRRTLIEAMRTRIMVHDPSIGDVEIRKFVALMTDTDDPENVSILDVAAVQSFIWQIKRKFDGQYKNEHPLMLIFAGGQGFGKSWTLERLLEPITSWTSGTQKMKVLKDPFSMNLFNRFFVVQFEDVHAERDIAMDMLKTVVTEPTVPYRVPFTPDVLRLPNNSTCYATTNFTTRDLLPDGSGARRWWEIVSPNRPRNADDERRFKAIDFDKLWRSVDGKTAMNPRRPYLDDFAAVQNTELKHETMFDAFFREELIMTHDMSDSLSQPDVYEHVRAWYLNQGAKPPFKKDLKELLRAKGVQVINTNNRPVYYGVRFNAEGV